MKTTMKIGSSAALATWARRNANLGLKVVAATAFAEVEKARVEAYEKPLFDSYGFKFMADEPLHAGETVGALIPFRYSWLVVDDRMTEFYEKAADLHAANGWKGERGYHPALVADNARIEAENELLEAGAREVMGVDPDRLIGATEELRTKALELLTGMLVTAASDIGKLRL